GQERRQRGPPQGRRGPRQDRGGRQVLRSHPHRRRQRRQDRSRGAQRRSRGPGQHGSGRRGSLADAQGLEQETTRQDVFEAAQCGHREDRGEVAKRANASGPDVGLAEFLVTRRGRRGWAWLFGRKSMTIPGVPDEDLLRLHWNYGGGRGAVGYRHIPSGITVARDCLPDVPTRQFYEEALAELERQLRERGLLLSTGETDADLR